MEEQLSLLDLVLHASFTVQLVMAILMLASMLSWYMIVKRFIYFRNARDEMYRFEERFWSGIDLSQLYREGNEKAPMAIAFWAWRVFSAPVSRSFPAWRSSRKMDSEAVIEGSRRAMRVAAMREEERLERHLAFLASVGSTSPYIGLFGTVWGIMHSFRGLANATQATLATVAPGISEALVATAMGLFAAIPAVLAYNRFASKVDVLSNRYDTFMDEFSSILYRQAYALRSREKQAG